MIFSRATYSSPGFSPSSMPPKHLARLDGVPERGPARLGLAVGGLVQQVAAAAQPPAQATTTWIQDPPAASRFPRAGGTRLLPQPGVG